MSHAEQLLEDFDVEMASTRRMLERIPEDKADWKPHDKSFSMGKLAMHVATLPVLAKYVMEDDGLDMANPTHTRPDSTFRTRAEMLATFDGLAEDTRRAVSSASDERLRQNWLFKFGDRVISNRSRSLTYRHMFLNHLIHHRGQLAVYLRLNGVPVPGMYGPSADEPFVP